MATKYIHYCIKSKVRMRKFKEPLRKMVGEMQVDQNKGDGNTNEM
jgi:hypothetical protein